MNRHALLATAAALACGLAASEASAAFDCEGGEIVIGTARAKTGGFAFFDDAGTKGFSVGVDQINAEGGIDGCPIRILQGDTQSNPALASQVAEELIRDGAQIIIAPSDFDIGIGASQAAQAAGVFSISPEASSEAWTQAVGPNFFLGGTTIADLAHSIAAFVNGQGWQGAYVVTNTAFNFFTEQERILTESIDGTVVGRDDVADDAADYSAVVSKIRAAGDAVDYVFLNDYFPHVATFVKQLRAAGVAVPVVGNGTFSSRDLPTVIGADAIQDVYYVASAYYEGEDVDAAVAAFIDDYEAAFGSFPENTNSIVGYYAAYILADGLRKAGSVDANALTEAIQSQADLALPGATYYAWENRMPRTSQTVIGFTDTGAFRQVEMVDPRSIP